MAQVGLALSGGGSRAAAFHRGTLRALDELGLLDHVEIVSSVSGGSVFAAAWAYARARGVSLQDFLSKMRDELACGFVCRTLRPRLLKTLVPMLGYTRTDALATTFDHAFFDGAHLSALPETPRLLLNTALLENGHLAQFCRKGLSVWDLHRSSPTPAHEIAVPDFPIALAVAASAAFPMFLPPVRVTRRKLGVEFSDKLGYNRLHLTDGGVIEDLGVQTLLHGHARETWDLIVSDANAPLPVWRPGFIGFALSFGAWLFSDGILERVMLLMNDKQNKWARDSVFEALQSSVLIDGLRSTTPAITSWLAGQPVRRPRNVLFARLQTNWDLFISRIAPLRLIQLGGTTEMKPDEILALLRGAGIAIDDVQARYLAFGGNDAAKRAAAVATNFTALSAADLDALEGHAYWQIHAAHAVYGFSAS